MAKQFVPESDYNILKLELITQKGAMRKQACLLYHFPTVQHLINKKQCNVNGLITAYVDT